MDALGGDSDSDTEVKKGEDSTPKKTEEINNDNKKKDDGSDSDSSSSSSSDSDSDSDSGKDKAKKGKRLKKKKFVKGGAAKAPKKKASKKSDSDSSDSSSSDDDSDDDLKKKKKKRPAASSSSKAEDFIASSDDEADLAKEYSHQKEYVDTDDPYRDDTNNPINPEGDGQVGEGQTKEPEDPRNFATIIKNMKAGRSASSKKKNESLSFEEQQVVELFLANMLTAAENDDKARAQGKPALHKLEMLDSVIAKIQQKDLRDELLDRNLLDILKRWLLPSKVDKQLPAQTIRTRILKVLPTLPIDRSLLENSEFGMVINMLRLHPKETKENKKLCTKLIQDWSKFIFGRAKHVDRDEEDEDRQQQQQQQQQQQRPPTPPRKRRASDSAPARQGGGLSELSKKKKVAKDAKNSFRARIPQPVDFDFGNVKVPDRMVASDAKMDFLRPSDARKSLEKKVLLRRKRK